MKKMIFALVALMVMTSCEQTLNDKGNQGRVR